MIKHLFLRQSDEKTFSREMTPLLAIRDACPKMLIANTRHEEYQYKGDT